jgi:hypothetical protein
MQVLPETTIVRSWPKGSLRNLVVEFAEEVEVMANERE